MISARNGRAIRRLQGGILLLSLAVLGSTGALLGSTAASAADSKLERFGDLQQAVAELRAEAGQERRTIVKANMLLTESEATTFWPLYDSYRADRAALGDRKVKLIGDFLSKRNAMGEDEAAALTKESLSIDKDTISAKEKWISKMSKVLSARTVSRFIQIDNKLDSVVNVELAARVPLVH